MPEPITAISPPPELKTETVSTIEQLRAIKIQDDAAVFEASAGLDVLNALRQKVVDFFEPMRKTTEAAHKAVTGAKARELAPIDEAVASVKLAILKYQREQRELREQEARRLKAEAEARAEEEKLHQALDVEADGDLEEAERVLDAPTAPVVIAPLAPALPKVKGLVLTQTWKAVVTDLRALIAGIVAGSVPIQAVKVDMAFLDNQAKALKGDLPYPGVIAVAEDGVTKRKG